MQIFLWCLLCFGDFFNAHQIFFLVLLVHFLVLLWLTTVYVLCFEPAAAFWVNFWIHFLVPHQIFTPTCCSSLPGHGNLEFFLSLLCQWLHLHAPNNASWIELLSVQLYSWNICHQHEMITACVWKYWTSAAIYFKLWEVHHFLSDDV